MTRDAVLARPRTTGLAVPLVFGALALLLAGCERVTHDMADQPRYGPQASSPQFADAQASRPPVPDAVPRAEGVRAMVSGGQGGQLPADPLPPPAVNDALLARGHERYEIYCLPCHGATGAGDGEVVRRGFPAPPPFAALRDASDQRLHDAVLHGTGRMAPFADRVSEPDAWAIVAWLRQLQGAAPAQAHAAKSR